MYTHLFAFINRWVWGVAFLLVVSSCGINSADHSTSLKMPLTIQTKPAEGGQVDSTGNQWQATASSGYIFKYWKITQSDSSLVAITTDTTTINPDSVKTAVAVFGKPNLDYNELIAGHNGRYAYFPMDFRLPSGTRKYALVRADLKGRTKQKVYITDKRIYKHDISYDNRYIAFSFITEDGASTQIYDIEAQQIINTISGGLNLDWANTENKLLVSAEDYICSYNTHRRQCRPIPLPPTDNPNVIGLTASAWSPNDEHLLLARDFTSFNVYDPQTWEYEKVKTGKFHVYFEWLDNNIFLTNGTYQEEGQFGSGNVSSVLRYALDTLSKDPENFPINTEEQAVSPSPDGNRLAYIHEGLNIYDIASGQTISLLSDLEYQPETIRWVQDDIILFYDRRSRMISAVDVKGNVTRL